MGDLCANCGWHTPCADYEGTYICIDEEICRQNQRINELTRERNTAIEERNRALTALSLSVEVVRGLLSHADGRLADDLRGRIMEASEAAAVALAG